MRRWLSRSLTCGPSLSWPRSVERLRASVNLPTPGKPFNRRRKGGGGGLTFMT